MKLQSSFIIEKEEVAFLGSSFKVKNCVLVVVRVGLSEETITSLEIASLRSPSHTEDCFAQLLK